jgi:hypothetical protein
MGNCCIKIRYKINIQTGFIAVGVKKYFAISLPMAIVRDFFLDIPDVFCRHHHKLFLSLICLHFKMY